MNKHILLIAGIALLLFYSAQQVVANTSANTAAADTIYYSVPDFYSCVPTYSRDTMFVFRCYDKRDSLIPRVDDYEQVRYYSVFKEYTDSTHTYKDVDGTKKYLPISVIVRRYDRVARDKWMCVAYPDNKYTELKADRSVDAGSVVIQKSRKADNVFDLVEVYKYYQTSVVVR